MSSRRSIHASERLAASSISWDGAGTGLVMRGDDMGRIELIDRRAIAARVAGSSGSPSAMSLRSDDARWSAVWCRSAGLFERALEMSASRRGSIAGATSLGRGGSWCTCSIAVWSGVSPSNGSLPVTI